MDYRDGLRGGAPGRLGDPDDGSRDAAAPKLDCVALRSSCLSTAPPPLTSHCLARCSPQDKHTLVIGLRAQGQVRLLLALLQTPAC